MEKTNKVREIWEVSVEILTFYIPDFILNKNSEKRQAWREKFALCTIIFINY